MNREMSAHQIDDCWNRIGVWSRNSDRCEKLQEHIHCYNCEVYTRSGRQLLDRPIPAGYLAEWSEFLSERHADRIKDLNSILVIRLGSEWLGIPVTLINEITLMRTIVPLPHNSKAIVRGLVNIRGVLTICLSMGALLGVRKPDDDWEENEHSIQRLIIINVPSGDVVIPVSEVFGIIRYENKVLMPPPTTTRNSEHNYIRGMIGHNNNDVGVLDANKILSTISDTLK